MANGWTEEHILEGYLSSLDVGSSERCSESSFGGGKYTDYAIVKNMEVPHHPPTKPEAPHRADVAADDGSEHDADLVKWFLPHTPVERIRYAEGFARNVLAMRRAQLT